MKRESGNGRVAGVDGRWQVAGKRLARGEHCRHALQGGAPKAVAQRRQKRPITCRAGQNITTSRPNDR